jgi:hypothetical protein
LCSNLVSVPIPDKTYLFQSLCEHCDLPMNVGTWSVTAFFRCRLLLLLLNQRGSCEKASDILMIASG